MALVVPAAVSALLFYTGFFSFVFAIPVQVTFTRHGERRGLQTAAATAAVILVAHVSQVMRLQAAAGVSAGALILDALMPAGFLAGLVVFNMARGLWWWRLMMATAVATGAALPGLVSLLGWVSDGAGGREQVAAVFAALGMGENWQIWLEVVRRVLFSSIVFGMATGIAANWWLGRSIVLRMYGEAGTLRKARVPEAFVWAVIAGLSLVVASWLREFVWAGVLGWNVLLFSAFLFAVQGVGIIQHLLALRGVGEHGQRMVVTGAIIGAIVPGINVLVLGGLPLLGISEIWIDYKRGEYDESNTQQ